MRMIMVVVPKNNGEAVLNALVNNGYTATFSETRGGMLRQSQISLFIAVQEAETDTVLDIIRANCRREKKLHENHEPHRYTPSDGATISLGGGVAFIWTLDKYENL